MKKRSLFEEVTAAQKQIDEVHAELEKITVQVDVGGGMVKVTATGTKRIIGVDLEPAVVNPDDLELLEDLIIAGVNKVLARAEQLANEAIRNKASSLFPPGFFP